MHEAVGENRSARDLLGAGVDPLDEEALPIVGIAVLVLAIDPVVVRSEEEIVPLVVGRILLHELACILLDVSGPRDGELLRRLEAKQALAIGCGHMLDRCPGEVQGQRLLDKDLADDAVGSAWREANDAPGADGGGRADGRLDRGAVIRQAIPLRTEAIDTHDEGRLSRLHGHIVDVAGRRVGEDVAQVDDRHGREEGVVGFEHRT